MPSARSQDVSEEQLSPIQAGAPASPQNSTDLAAVSSFQPTRGMLRWLQAAMELGYAAKITEVAKEAGLDRDNWYQWLEKPGFVEWWDAQWARYLKVNRWKLDAVGMRQAERSFDYWRAMQERTGNLAPESSQQAPITNVQVNVTRGNDQ